MELPSVDELLKFSTNKGKAETVVILNPYDITDFPDHPFKITDNEEMDNMVESIKEIGVKVPILVRPKQNGGYEMVAGHRRNYATKKAGLDGIPAIVREMTDEEATIIMVDSNIQREKVLPSEKAFAYKMKLEAIKRQAGRPKKENSRQVVGNYESADLVGKDNGESGRQVQRYIRLTELIQELLDMVDIGKISFSPAVEISYLSKEEQNLLLCYIKKYDATPSQSQAIYLKKLSQEGKLTTDKLEEIMSAEKPNQKPKYNIHYDRFEKYLPRDVVTEKEVEDFLFKCVEEHHRRLKQRQMAR
ncbi:MAG: ParB/RepB/Spo0J family partition protein [Clostridia bacterium]|uniref:ParB/RepB/Spo0J family partition protein n=1 Tax=uncultured Clostridium sp. TaxID=59620 RepID=UPI0027299006|nr:ParB/RepB/Spo0J family partition protein [uncultured Clostridium sp.]